jgi:uncharacterized protein YoxC
MTGLGIWCVALLLIAIALFFAVVFLILRLTDTQDWLARSRSRHDKTIEEANTAVAARDRQIEVLKEQVERLESRNGDLVKWQSEHEDAFDQIFALAQKHARPF